MKPFTSQIFVVLAMLTAACGGELLHAQSDDAPLPVGKPEDEALWNKLDITSDGWLDGTELNGGWKKYDTDGDEEVTKEEFLAGRARERKSGSTTGRAKRNIAVQRSVAAAAKRIPKSNPVSTPAASKPVKLSRLAPRRGYIIGRAIKSNGTPIPAFKVMYSGFEDGKLANYSASGYAMETINSEAKGSGGRYAIKVPPGAYRVRGYVTYKYNRRIYNFDMETLNEPKKHDYDGLGLDKLRNGLVRDFMLKMTEKKRGASEETETVYKHAYYGARLDIDCRQAEAILGGGHKPDTPLRDAYPADSQIFLTLTPKGKMVDGTTGSTKNARLRLGDDGKWTFNVRGIYPGAYTATARLAKPDGEVVPLRMSLKPVQWILKGAGEYDKNVMEWKSSVTVDFLPNDLGPVPRFGTKPITLYLGQ